MPNRHSEFFRNNARALRYEDNVIRYQKELVRLGFDLGKFGPEKNGIDGVPGPRTRDAIGKLLDYQHQAGIGDFETLAEVFKDIRQHRTDYQRLRRTNLRLPETKPPAPESSEHKPPLTTEDQPVPNQLYRQDEVALTINKIGKTLLGNSIGKDGKLPGRIDPVTGKRVITYTMDSDVGNVIDSSSFDAYGNSIKYGETNAGRLDNERKAIFREAFRELENKYNLTYQEVRKAKPGEVDIVIRQSDLSGIGGYATPGKEHCNISINRNDTSASSIKQTAVHEAMHLLGLEDPDENTLTKSGYPLKPHKNHGEDYVYLDSRNGSNMSYNPGNKNKAGGDATANLEPESPQYFDDLVLQKRLGANQEHNAGNTQYKLDGASVARTIWDAKGNFDRLTAAANSSAILDLREGPGNVSKTGSTRVWISQGSNIESAVGSEHNDVLYSGSKEHWLTGGGGNDKFVVSKPGSITHITDYQVAGDQLKFDATRLKGTIHVSPLEDGKAYVYARHINDTPMEIIVNFKTGGSVETALSLAQQLKAAHPDHTVEFTKAPRSLETARKDIIFENARNTYKSLGAGINLAIERRTPEQMGLKEITKLNLNYIHIEETETISSTPRAADTQTAKKER